MLATPAPALGPFEFSFSMPLEIGDGRRERLLDVLQMGLFLFR